MTFRLPRVSDSLVVAPIKRPARPKVISRLSYRGGTGQSNLTATLATTVPQQGFRVGVVDTDMPSPGIHNIFDLGPERITKTLNSYLWGEAELADGAYDCPIAMVKALQPRPCQLC